MKGTPMRLFQMATILFLLAQSGVIAVAQTPSSPPPPNTISCDGFTKLPNGDWYAKPNNPPFGVSIMNNMILRDSTFGARAYTFNGYDLAIVLNQKCAD
jgi:hypothetical protein